MSEPENPQAFPGQPRDSDDMPCADHMPGMTLRDWFAGQALAVAKDSAPEWQLTAWFGNRAGISRAEILAKSAYDIADAMLLARATRKESQHG